MTGSWIIVAKFEKDEETGEPLCWSDVDGWVNKDTASVYTTNEKEAITPPMNSSWECID